MTTVEDLLPYLRTELIFVNDAATPDHVRTLMIINRISRVPIINGKGDDLGNGGRTCRGIVRMRAFFDRLDAPMPKSLDEVLEKAPPEVEVRDTLFHAVERLRGRPEVLIRGNDGVLKRMLTPRGLADWWHAYSRPFLIVEELEKALRDILRPFEGNRLLEAVSKERVTLLNPSDYQMACDKLWEDLPALAGLEKGVVMSVLGDFAQQRNRLMHFRVDDKSLLDRHLRRFAQLQDRIRLTAPAI